MLSLDGLIGGMAIGWELEGGTTLGGGTALEQGTTLEGGTTLGGTILTRSVDERGGWPLEIEESKEIGVESVGKIPREIFLGIVNLAIFQHL